MPEWLADIWGRLGDKEEEESGIRIGSCELEPYKFGGKPVEPDKTGYPSRSIGFVIALIIWMFLMLVV